jgi:2-succinyl-5-enolpyruvyl-6-hydroxy-3-cyclohexene-1-carboxylate synthase
VVKTLAPEAANANFAFAHALLDELARAGVAHVCTCPGSRSAPLAVAAERVGLRTWTHVDERAAGFFALGLARATGCPTALVCTSGTAAANFAPAVAEAFTGRVPLVLLTADRPPELRGWGAGQTVTQTGIYGGHLRWFAEAPLPEPRAEILRHARVLAARAAAGAAGPPAGPVHLNLPFREPLHPEPCDAEALAAEARREPHAVQGRGDGPYTLAHAAADEPDPSVVERVAAAVRDSERGVLLCGPQQPAAGFADAAVRLARAAGWPILPDVLAGVRRGPHTKEAPLVTHFDALLRPGGAACETSPDCVVRFGDTPTSKAARQWLAAASGARQILIDGDGAWHDPDFRASEIVRANPARLAAAVAERLEASAPSSRRSAWLETWLAAEKRAAGAVAQQLDAEPTLFEPRVVRELAEILPDGATLFVSNSMPVRDADGFLPAAPRRLRVLGNRGANGIDGITSTALGVAAASDEPVVLLTGDLALLHDLGGLLAARRHGLRLVIVVLQNQGGGIFSYLPIAEAGPEVAFRKQFVGPHDLDLHAAATLFSLGYERADDADALRVAVASALAARRTTLVEVPIDADDSVAHHRALWRAMAEASR